MPQILGKDEKFDTKIASYVTKVQKRGGGG
jgi:hypothetical protein